MNRDERTHYAREGAGIDAIRPPVTARFFADLRDLFGSTLQVPLDGPRDVAGLVAALCDTPLRRSALLGEHGECSRRVAILVNGRNIAFLEGEATTLGDGDVVDFFPPVFGG